VPDESTEQPGMSESFASKSKQMKSRKYMLVRYGRMNSLGFFEHNEDQIPRTACRIVIKTDRGLELGCIIGQVASYKDGRLKLTEDQLSKYFADSEIPFSVELMGKFVRYATDEDIAEQQHLQKIARQEVECCARITKELNLSMNIVDAEHILGGERIIFYFMAEGRVDFRELVKRLAQEFQTRIEMRQIGSRDEAKLLGDIESCGQECCCIKFLQILKPVNMRMAKMQKATLDPAKISGYCGRLKCCLRYEDQTYIELKKRLPRKSSRVRTKNGEGKVIDTQILTQLVIVEYDSGEKAAFPLEEIELVSGGPVVQDPREIVSDEGEQDVDMDKQQ
jgi:cell fate regulator YaaT (PSP1 superfamily)